MNSEIEIRLGCFFGIFAVVAICEILAPRRMLTTSKKSRWFSNLALLSLNPILVRLVFPLLPVGMSILAQERHWALLNNIDMPYWLRVVMGVIVLDFAIYF